MIPCVGAGITVAVPKLRKWSSREVWLRRAYVISQGEWRDGRGFKLWWRSGSVTGEVWEEDEGVEWIHGHGPQARAALLVARGLG